MGIADRILGAMAQTAVYWDSPIPDGHGTYTYDSPIEINCRWENKSEVIKDDKGEEIVSFAQVYVDQDVSENGYLFLGDLDDLDSAEEESPETAYGSYRIKKFEKSAEHRSTTQFLRKAYL